MRPGAKDGGFHVFMKKVHLLPLLIFQKGTPGDCISVSRASPLVYRIGGHVSVVLQFLAFSTCASCISGWSLIPCLHCGASLRRQTVLCVGAHEAFLHPWLREDECLTASCKFVFRNIQFQRTVLDIDFDYVSILYQCNRPADGCFRRDVSDNRTVAESGKNGRL